MSDQIKLTDVARASGFSPATVSLALRNKPGVAPATRERIIEIAATLGYVQRSPEASNKTPTPLVGLLMKARADLPHRGGPFYAPVLAGIEDICRQQHFNLLYATVLVDSYNRPREVPALLSNENLKGLLVVGAWLDPTLETALSHLPTPVILVDAYATEAGKYDAVLSDNFQGAYTAVEHLWQYGHRHIALVGGGPEAFPSIAERYRGYRQALLDHGMINEYCAACELHSEAAFEATRTLLRQYPEITAIFGCNDEVALAAIQAARELGRTVPQTLSVVGFDDIEVARHVTPPLTTLRVDKVLMGQMAMRALLWRLENPEAPHMVTQIHTPLIQRQSVAKHP